MIFRFLVKYKYTYYYGQKMQKKSSIVILTGAGISAESGLATFRNDNGTWNKYRIEDVATPQAFQENPERVQDFYNHRRKDAQNAKPNPAHIALYKLEQQWQDDFLLITQNVDDLHEKAGSKKLVHMHGSLNSALCNSCHQTSSWHTNLNATSTCPHCKKSGHMRPDIVWFGEMPHHMDRIEQALVNADIFIAIGTSGQVYPAAGFVSLASAAGAQCIEMNLICNNTISSLFVQHINGKASKTVPKFIDELLQSNA